MTKTSMIDEKTALEDHLKQSRIQMGRRFKWARERFNISQKKLSKELDVSQQYIQKIENGEIKNPSIIPEAAQLLKVDIEWLTGAKSLGELVASEIENRKFIDEIAQNGEASEIPWSIPPAALGLPPQSLSGLEIRAVVGDAMAPDFSAGDHVVVNTADIIPSPAGIFMIHDGHGLQLRRIEPIPGKKLRISASNPSYAPFEDAAESVTIYGRIVLKISKV